MLIMGDQSLQERVVERIRGKFKVTEGGCDFLGLHIEHDLARGTLKVHQKAFAEALVKSTGYADSKPVPTPLPTDFTAADPDPPEDAKDGSVLDFPSVVGSIGWLATHATCSARTASRTWRAARRRAPFAARRSRSPKPILVQSHASPPHLRVVPVLRVRVAIRQDRSVVQLELQGAQEGEQHVCRLLRLIVRARSCRCTSEAPRAASTVRATH